MFANFLLGSLHITAAAKAALGRMPLDLIARHAINDHGNLYPREVRTNRTGMRECGRIVSRFPVDPFDKSQGNVLVITSRSWDETVVQLESE
ncbi:hypothetical protein QTI66_32950 [Variovorax sp. J22R133]|uniref:hypothetical protein n=1 Tax=Variovorax brevis TaxID=3053503 RepID=UPI002577C1C8|nr:hypothetical protein [Variovorax sp. J22R133]MDM0116938.1 hypothetical protein [Variovorax sp. J22R133]